MGDENQTRIILTFAMGFLALLMFVLASQAEMPVQAILIAIGISNAIFLLLLLAGKVIPGNRK